MILPIFYTMAIQRVRRVRVRKALSLILSDNKVLRVYKFGARAGGQRPGSTQFPYISKGLYSSLTRDQSHEGACFRLAIPAARVMRGSLVWIMYRLAGRSRKIIYTYNYDKMRETK